MGSEASPVARCGLAVLLCFWRKCLGSCGFCGAVAVLRELWLVGAVLCCGVAVLCVVRCCYGAG